MNERGAYSGARAAAPAVFCILPALFLAASAVLSFRIVQERSSVANAVSAPATRERLLFEISRHPAFAFGFRNFLSDVAWLGAVQAAGSRRLSRDDYDRLYLLLKTVGGLDARFDVPYILGALVLGDSPDHVGAALETLERGRRHHPDKWVFPFYIGYIKYFSVGDPNEGGKALEEAAGIPGSPPYLPLLASRMLAEGRNPETALALLRRLESDETDPSRLEIVRRRIREVIVERDIQALETTVARFREATGGFPATLDALVRAGFIRKIPDEPNGGRYVISPDGTVASTRVTTRLKVFRKK